METLVYVRIRKPINLKQVGLTISNDKLPLIIFRPTLISSSFNNFQIISSEKKKPLFLPLQTIRWLRIQKKTTYQKIIRELRSTAIFSALAPRHIISETTRILSQNISAILQEYITLQGNIPKIRQRANMLYPFPRSSSDLIIPDEFKNTFR
ncbi:hypothetical protein HZS_2606 [Henneguya salminicola]|nr:hypothetical protein HZS_2606 [Henneguya salminicola]